MTDDRIMSPADTAEMVGRSVKTLEAWRAAGTGPPFLEMNGRFYGYRRGDVEAWLAGLRKATVR